MKAIVQLLEVAVNMCYSACQKNALREICMVKWMSCMNCSRSFINTSNSLFRRQYPDALWWHWYNYICLNINKTHPIRKRLTKFTSRFCWKMYSIKVIFPWRKLLTLEANMMLLRQLKDIDNMRCIFICTRTFHVSHPLESGLIAIIWLSPWICCLYSNWIMQKPTKIWRTLDALRKRNTKFILSTLNTVYIIFMRLSQSFWKRIHFRK